jgi:hypothetical protein
MAGQNEVSVEAKQSDPVQTCRTCGSSTCLALVRADEAPKDWKDVVSRSLILVSSRHWSWSKTIQVLGTAGTTVVAVWLALGHWVALHQLTDSPWRLGSAVGLVGAIVGARVIWKRGRTRRERK